MDVSEGSKYACTPSANDSIVLKKMKGKYHNFEKSFLENIYKREGYYFFLRSRLEHLSEM